MFPIKLLDIRTNASKFFASIIISSVLCILVFIYQSYKINIFEINQRLIMNTQDFVETIIKIDKDVAFFKENKINFNLNSKTLDFQLDQIKNNDKWYNIINEFDQNIQDSLFKFIHGNIFIENFNKSPLKYYKEFKNRLKEFYPNLDNYDVLDQLFENNTAFFIYFEEMGFVILENDLITFYVNLIYEDDNSFIKNDVIGNLNLQNTIGIYINYYFERNFYDIFKTDIENFFKKNIDEQITIYNDLKKLYYSNNSDIEELKLVDMIIYEYEGIKETLTDINVAELNLLPVFIKFRNQDIYIINSLFNISTYVIFFILNFMIIYLIIFYFYNKR